MNNEPHQSPQCDKAALQTLLHSYRWPELWQVVRHLQPEPGAQRTPALAIKALLLAGWWQEDEQAQACVAAYPGRITDPLTHFALSYATMCLTDAPRYTTLRRYPPRQQAPWMRQWLELEMLGRSGKTPEQISLLRQFIPTGKQPPVWVCVALLQSNESSCTDVGSLLDWLQAQPPGFREQDLPRALAARCGMANAWMRGEEDEPFEKMPPPVLYRCAMHMRAHGQLVEALRAFDVLARTVFVDLSALQAWLGLACSIPQGWAALGERTQFAVNLVPRSLTIQGTVACYALIAAWLRGDMAQSGAIVERFVEYLKLPKSPLIRNSQVFFFYVGKLQLFRQENQALYLATPSASAQALVALGESHSLTLSGVYGPWLGETCKALSAFVMGVKMHHLAEPTSSYQGECVRLHLEALKAKPVHLLLTIGEIDCRPDEGIWPLHRKTGQPLDALIERTVSGYIDFLQRTLVGHQLASITIQGIPAPGYAFEDDKDPGDIPGFVAMIRAVNERLRSQALAAGFRFLDVYAATVGEDGRGNCRWHLDGYHLSPAFYRQAQDWLLIKSGSDSN